MMDRPLLTFRIGRTWTPYRWPVARELRVVIILAPFPYEEQVPGELVAALVNAQVSFRLSWPFVDVNVYAPDRWTRFFSRGRHD